MSEERTNELKAQNYAAMLDGASVINTVIATHNKGSDATDSDFAHDMTHDEKKARVNRSMGYLKVMVALDDWGSEDMTDVNAAISAGEAFVG
tara:strand:- start:1063 stop:1338 length:276 start_codon:yes stop_codon:yes gene_type:complete